MSIAETDLVPWNLNFLIPLGIESVLIKRNVAKNMCGRNRLALKPLDQWGSSFRGTYSRPL